MTLIKVEGFLSSFHPFLSQLFGILFSKRGLKGRLTAYFIFTEAEEI
jgi:hypothetical protein